MQKQTCKLGTGLLYEFGTILIFFFYRSTIYRLISEGVSDLHCMSDEYLTEELISEYKESCLYGIM